MLGNSTNALRCRRLTPVLHQLETAMGKRATLIGLLLIAAATLPVAGCRGAHSMDPAQIAAVYVNCLAAMRDATCAVMRGQSLDTLPEDTRSVLIAGVGAVDAEIYRTLRGRGDSMCALVRAECTERAAGPLCRTAVSLYGVAQQ